MSQLATFLALVAVLAFGPLLVVLGLACVVDLAVNAADWWRNRRIRIPASARALKRRYQQQRADLRAALRKNSS